jgi:hypothetical protein
MIHSVKLAALRQAQDKLIALQDQRVFVTFFGKKVKK